MECLDEVEVLSSYCRCCQRFLGSSEESTSFVTTEIQEIFFDLINEELGDGLICGDCSDHLRKFQRFKADIIQGRRPQQLVYESTTENLIEEDHLDDAKDYSEKHEQIIRSKVDRATKHDKKSRKSVLCSCGKTVTLKALTTHIKRHESNRERRFMCEICSKTYLNKHELVVHQRNHLNFRPFECDFDGKAFTCKNNLNKHIQSQHLNQRRRSDLKVNCPACEKLFPFQSKMIEHYKKAHPGGYDDGVKVNPKTNHFHCDQCKCEFLTKFRIDNHICIAGGQESSQLENQCPVCLLVCKNRLDLIKHFQEHGEKLNEKNKWRCKVCQVIVNNKIAVHIENTHSSGSVLCSLCNKSLKNRKSLRQHLYLSHQNGYEIRKNRKKEI